MVYGCRIYSGVILSFRAFPLDAERSGSVTWRADPPDYFVVVLPSWRLAVSLPIGQRIAYILLHTASKGFRIPVDSLYRGFRWTDFDVYRRFHFFGSLTLASHENSLHERTKPIE